MTVGDMTARMTAAEENGWMAFYEIAPFGDQRADLRSAQITQMVHNANSKKPKKLMEFMMFSDKPKAIGNSSDEIRNNFENMIARQGKR